MYHRVGIWNGVKRLKAVEYFGGAQASSLLCACGGARRAAQRAYTSVTKRPFPPLSDLSSLYYLIGVYILYLILIF